MRVYGHESMKSLTANLGVDAGQDNDRSCLVLSNSSKSLSWLFSALKLELLCSLSLPRLSFDSLRLLLHFEIMRRRSLRQVS